MQRKNKSLHHQYDLLILFSYYAESAQHVMLLAYTYYTSKRYTVLNYNHYKISTKLNLKNSPFSIFIQLCSNSDSMGFISLGSKSHVRLQKLGPIDPGTDGQIPWTLHASGFCGKAQACVGFESSHALHTAAGQC